MFLPQTQSLPLLYLAKNEKIPPQDLNVPLQTYQQKLLKDFYRISEGDILASHSSVSLFISLVRNQVYKEYHDIDLAKSIVRKNLEKQPDLAEHLIFQAQSYAVEFLHTYVQQENSLKEESRLHKFSPFFTFSRQTV